MQVWWKKKLKTCNDFFIFLVGKETPDANMKHKYPLMLTGYRFVESFTLYVLYH